MMRFLILLLLLAANVYAQPQPPPLSNPVALTQGGSEISNVLTTVSTNGSLNNLALSSSILKFIGTSAQTVTGIASAAKAQRVILLNINSSGTLQLNHESGSSTAVNRLNLPNSSNYVLPYNTGIELVYDTNSSRWRVSSEYINVSSPLYKSSSQVGIYQATSGQNGFLTSSDYTTYLDNWKQTGNDIYNTNVNNVWISLYSCATLTTYADCSAKVSSGCTLGASASCSTYDGNESSCNSVAGSTCYWNSGDSTCTGNYFQSGDCSGNYNFDDGTNSKLQVKATIQCSGSSNACSTYNSDSGQCSAQGCSFTSNSCPSYYDESSCNSSYPCYWGNNPQSCSPYNGDNYTCTNTSGCSFNECSSYSSDESTCTSANAACSWSVTPCSTYNGDQYNCENSTGGNCSWSDPDCTGAGFNGTCSGTWCSGSYDSYSCLGDNGGCNGSPYSCASRSDSSSCTAVLPCSWTTTPAGRFQGDLITTSATGTNKVVCIKSNGALGTCSAGVSGTSCTCS